MNRPTLSSRERGGVLLLILFAFAHVVFGLASKSLWWDESLSLQRAEEGLWNLLQGVLTIKDGIGSIDTIDQHPFFSFLLQGTLIRVAGNSEYVLRFVSAAAATLMVPALWVFARLFVRKQILPDATPWMASLLAAASPFLLWYGQEARGYALWATLAVLSTYLLITALEVETASRWRRVAYVVALGAFLATHYYAVFLLPVHALILIAHFWSRNRRVAVVGTLIFLAASVLIMGYAYWNVVRQAGGANFPKISLGILLPDLLNAFTLGLSVNIDQVRWLDGVFAVLALLGAGWTLRSRQSIARGGWVLPLAVLVPVGVLLLGNTFQNLYMNARHMSLIAGPLLLLIGAGVALLWSQWHWGGRWAGGALMVLLLAGFAYSTVNYYSQEEYAKDDYARFGAYLDGRIMPGDVVLYYPASSWRIFEYYAPMLPVQDALEQGGDVGIFGVPLLHDDEEFTETFTFLSDLGNEARRIWLFKSGTHPYYDLDGRVETWLRENFLQVRNVEFFSHSSLRAQLYLPEVPVVEGDPGVLPNATAVQFGDNIRLAGYTMTPDSFDALPTPVTLYWQVDETPDRRYKYILELLRAEGETTGDETLFETLGSTEREPYEGDIPTTFWDPDRTIIEFVEMKHAPFNPATDRLYLALQLYDAETLEKVPVTDAAGLQTDMDGQRVLLPLVEFAGWGTP